MHNAVTPSEKDLTDLSARLYYKKTRPPAVYTRGAL